MHPVSVEEFNPTTKDTNIELLNEHIKSSLSIMTTNCIWLAQ